MRLLQAAWVITFTIYGGKISQNPIIQLLDCTFEHFYPIVLCQDCSSDACNEDPMIGVELRLVSQDPNQPALTNIEMLGLEKCIFNAIITKSDQSLRPQFIKFERKIAFVAITAANKMTQDWLQKYAKVIGEPCKVPFQVISADQMPRINVVQGKFDQENKPSDFGLH